jgi:hypothetical protein
MIGGLDGWGMPIATGLVPTARDRPPTMVYFGGAFEVASTTIPRDVARRAK